MNLKSANLKNKRVFLRVDFNVPTDKEGNIADDTRIQAAKATIDFLFKNGAKQIIIATHFGRPEGKIVEKMRVDFIAKYVEKVFAEKVLKLDEVTPKNIPENARIVMLENLRFDPREEKNDVSLAKSWANIADIYVNDAFGCSHRAHCSIVAITKFLPSYAGLLLQKEIDVLSKVLNNPEKPLSLIIAGAKIDSKIGVLKNFIHKAQNILVGGGIANTFLAAEGYDIAQSLCQKDKIDTAQEILMEAEECENKFILPIDVIVASEITKEAIALDIPIEDVEGDMKILDIGSKSIKQYIDVINTSKMIIWNGPLGLFEYKQFEKGSKLIAEALAKSKAKVIIGGGETINALKQFGISEDKFYHVSTGGGAMLEFLEGIELPGIKALKNKK